MNFLRALDISASGLYAQKRRMETIAQNIANADTIVTDTMEPYRRKLTIFSAVKKENNFSDILDNFSKPIEGEGVSVSIAESNEDPLKLVYNPEHPLASEEGYVQMPNVDTTVEMLELLSATRSYEANITVMNATKTMFSKLMEIGK